MTISITNLAPVKNEENISVNSNIEIEITSTDLDLQVTSVELLINEVPVQPSAYYGSTEKIIDITFYSRRRIKYKTKKYGQEDFRYGQEDIFPSVFQYDSRYVCTIIVFDVEGNKFEENFSFNTEEGIYYNVKPKHYYYSQETQALANYLPLESRARYDNYSIFQQLINPSSIFLEEINSLLYKQISNYFVQTSDLNEMATVNTVKLGGDYKFSTTVLDDGTRLQIPPEVIATKDITRYYPTTEFSNNIKDFYYNKLPTRLDEVKCFLSSFVFLSKRKIDVNKIQVNRELERTGYICLAIEDGIRFTQTRNNSFDILTCRIIGVSREGKKQTEDIVIIDNDNYITFKLWSQINTIQFINIPTGTDISFTITYGRPNGSYVLDSFKAITLNNQERPVFWRKAENSNGSVLQQYGLLKTEIEDIISSLAEKDLLAEYELVDVDNETAIRIIDIEVNTFSNFIYGISNDFLYIFHKREPYPKIIKELPKNNGSADFIIDLVSDNLVRNAGSKLIEFTGIQKTMGKEIAQFRFKIRKPDGTYEYINEESQLVTKEKATLLGNPIISQIKTKNIKYYLTEPGDYIIYLETIYRDGSTDIDAKVARVMTKAALAKYKLGRLFKGVTIQNMFMDFDQRLKIYDSNKELHTIHFSKDNMLIDYSNAILFFNEGYDKVEVKND